MKFEIDFNHENDGKFLTEKLGVEWVSTGSTKYPPFEVAQLEINSFEELENILKIVEDEKGDYYSAVISFDPPIIFLDNKV